MKNCALYSSYMDLDPLVDLIQELYPQHTVQVNEDKTKIRVISKKWFRQTVKGFNIMTSRTQPEEFASMIDGMGSYFAQIPARNETVHQKLLLKIATLNMVIGIETEEEISDDFFAELLTIAGHLDGLVFWGTRQLLNADGKLLLDLDGNSEVEDYTVTAHDSFLYGDAPITESGQQRKERSERILSEKNIPYNPNLPGYNSDEGARIRSLEETARRAIALCIVALKGECIYTGESEEETQEFIGSVIDQYGASAFFSPIEEKFIASTGLQQKDAIPFSWCYEGYWVMLWALGYVEELGDPTSVCNVEDAVSILQERDSFESFKADARMRSQSEILDAADLIYRYDWVCVDSRIHDRMPPGDLDGGVVYERHRALNWLIHYLDQEWDDVRTDT